MRVIKYIEVSVKGKPSIKLELVTLITKEEALQLQALIESNPEVRFCKCWTTKNTFI